MMRLGPSEVILERPGGIIAFVTSAEISTYLYHNFVRKYQLHRVLKNERGMLNLGRRIPPFLGCPKCPDQAITIQIKRRKL